MRQFKTILLFAIATFSLSASAWHHGNNKGVIPRGDDGFLVFMANGVYDPTEPPPVSTSGDYFDEVIMGRDAAEKAARQTRALDYFIDRFGVQFLLVPRTPIAGGDLVGIALDPTSPTGVNENVILVHGYQDTRWGYTAHVIGGERVGRRGRKVHDASYNMVVVDPAGFTFHGTWGGASGIAVAAGTVAVNGEYLIEHPRRSRRDIHITWESTDPIFDAFDPAGITFDCAMHSERWGDGIALGRQFIRPVGATGDVQAIIRNVLNFPAPVSLRP